MPRHYHPLTSNLSTMTPNQCFQALWKKVSKPEAELQLTVCLTSCHSPHPGSYYWWSHLQLNIFNLDYYNKVNMAFCLCSKTRETLSHKQGGKRDPNPEWPSTYLKYEHSRGKGEEGWQVQGQPMLHSKTLLPQREKRIQPKRTMT